MYAELAALARSRQEPWRTALSEYPFLKPLPRTPEALRKAVERGRIAEADSRFSD